MSRVQSPRAGLMLAAQSSLWWATLGRSCFHQGHIQFARNRDRGFLDFAYDLHNVVDTVYFQAVFRLKCVPAALQGVTSG